ncbi:MAG: hypothetical protein V1663_00020 [archaeon]
MILLLGIAYLFLGLGNNSEKAACKNWVNLQASTKPAGIQVSSIKSPCVTFEETIKKDNNEQEIYETLARSMYDCWDMYGRGKIDFFSDWDSFQGDTHCRICTKINVDQDINGKINIDRFEEYLSKHNAPGHEESYAEFFLGSKNTKVDFGSGDINLDYSIPLYIVFTVSKSRGSIGPSGGELAVAGGACWNAGQIGLFIGSFFPIPGASIIGGVGGCALGFVGSSIYSVTSHKTVLHPSLIFFTGKEVIDIGCDDTYYNPKKELFEGFGGGSSGGGGAGGQTP